MFKSATLLALVLSSTASFANTGIVPPYILKAIEEAKKNAYVCENDEYSFNSYTQELTIGNDKIAMDCETVELPSKGPDAGGTILSCVESEGFEGRLVLDVEIIGLLGVKTATVGRQQMFPLPAHTFAQLPCDQK